RAFIPFLSNSFLVIFSPSLVPPIKLQASRCSHLGGVLTATRFAGLEPLSIFSLVSFDLIRSLPHEYELVKTISSSRVELLAMKRKNPQNVRLQLQKGNPEYEYVTG
ncbi:MAG: hypothetical protein AB1847_23510, partial [bacterium]